MSKPLVIVESPTKVKTISKILGSEYIVKSSVGHIRDLPRNTKSIPPEYTKEEILKSYKKIMKKIHPDVSPELTRLASIVNEAKEVVLKDLS